MIRKSSFKEIIMLIGSRGVVWMGAGLMATLVAAADEAPASAELETITVTATKRAEAVQDVPLSMTTFGAAALEEKAINTFFDYATKVPNLAFAPTGDGVGTARTISIRGVSGDNVTGFYIDDTPLPDSLDPRVLDIDHIEVLRGPQGTLYGARSMGGTVRIITKEPNLEDFDATVHAAASSTARTDQPNWTGLSSRLLQAQLLYGSGRGDGIDLHTAVHHRHHDGRQCRCHQYLRRCRQSDRQARRLADRHAARHDAARRL
jgi:outer membrane receptor protein involved in Fe transport